MKAFTDIEQSNKLAEFLPIESADMWYHGHCSPWESERKYDDEPCLFHSISPNWDKPCWSLAALLNVIKPINENTYTIRGTLDGGATISFDEITSVMFQEEEIIDAVFEMVCWLKKNGKI